MVSIEQLDPNFMVPSEITDENLIWLDAKSAPFALYGVFYDDEAGGYLRMDPGVAQR